MIAAPAPPAALLMTPHCPPLEDRPGRPGYAGLPRRGDHASPRGVAGGRRHRGRPLFRRIHRGDHVEASVITDRAARSIIQARGRCRDRGSRFRPQPADRRGAVPRRRRRRAGRAAAGRPVGQPLDARPLRARSDRRTRRRRPPSPRRGHGQNMSAGGGPDAIATAKPTVTGGGQRGIEPPGPLSRLGERRANVNCFDRRLDHGHRPAPRRGTRSPSAAAPRA